MISDDNDGDEIFIPFNKVRCCVIGFKDGISVYSKLVPVNHNGILYACCNVCGGNYGEINDSKDLL